MTRATPSARPEGIAASGRSRFTLHPGRICVVAGLVHDLRFVLVQIEAGVQLRLLRQKILEAGFVLEGPAQLRAVIGQGLCLPVDFKLFVLDAAIETAKGGCRIRCRFRLSREIRGSWMLQSVRQVLGGCAKTGVSSGLPGGGFAPPVYTGVIFRVR